MNRPTTLLALIACSAACVSPTGVTRELSVENEGMSSRELFIHAGDAVRISNKRSVPIFVTPLGGAAILDCGDPVHTLGPEPMLVAPGTSEQLCFGEPGAVSLIIQSPSEQPNATQEMVSTVRVGGKGPQGVP